MLNQVAVEALYSATYVENYLDSVENLPDDVQKYLSRIREIDVQFRAHLRDSDYYYEQWSNCPTSELESANAKRSRAMARIQQSFIASQELGDEKLQIVTQLQELIDQKTRQLEHDFKNLDYGKDDVINDVPQKEQRLPSPTMNLSITGLTTAQQIFVASPVAASTSGSGTTTARESFSGSNSNGERASKRARRTRADTLVGSADPGTSDNNTTVNEVTPAKQSNNTTQNTGSVQKKGTGQTGKKKKRKARGGAAQGSGNNQTRDRDDTPPAEEPIDPDEPTYCLCDQISFGEMILCDNDLCPIEWFHFSCVSLMSKPKGKWYCPNCRGDRPNVMKPKAQFLKELERYNKEKEEKT
ncbi:inhibitor of growth protein 1 [Lutzomyia longipalpis]|uniref:inhibitor of growth protein 1 n=1 Tax=Lutzomyia longipalpis TaxID=7200 RepID=UPI002484387B|nr:inhibitor of growth protein 1 [Lutzomyia longipalpis]